MDEVQFTNTSKGAEKYTWNFSIINQTSQEKNPSIMFENAGTYAIALVAQSNKQCLDTVVKSIFINTDFTAYVPNVFTPNGDNLNDVFQPITHGSLQYHLQIFNRWGQKLFESKNAQAAWDGTFKGELCKPDVYVWKLIISNSKEERELSGTVMLER